jgi:hypothetical protein
MLTGADIRALRAAVEIVDLYSYVQNPDVVKAFGLVVMQMQKHTRFMAFHAVAHVMDWGHRVKLWREAGLKFEDYLNGAPECAHAPRRAEHETSRLHF